MLIVSSKRSQMEKFKLCFGAAERKDETAEALLGKGRNVYININQVNIYNY